MSKKTSDKSPTKDEIVLIALTLSEQLGWEHITLGDIAAQANISLAQLHDVVDDKMDILSALGRMIDRIVLEEVGAGDAASSPRDRLFDVLMERFDALNEHRDGIVAIMAGFRFEPKEAIISAPYLCRSMGWMLEAAGLDTNGLKGTIRILGLTGVYLKTLKIWMRDESPDLGKTMAALDRNIGQAERFANTFGF